MANGMKDLLFIVKHKRVICMQNKEQKSTFTFCKLLVFSSLLLLPACVPCCYKIGIIFDDYVTIVYPGYQGCTSKGTCGRLRVYVVKKQRALKPIPGAGDSAYTIIDTLCMPQQSSEPLDTDCHVTVRSVWLLSDSTTMAWVQYVVVHIEGTAVWDTVYEIVTEDPCNKGQWLQPQQRHRYRTLCNINGEWYEGPVIYRE